jgi:ribonucleoside-diphosphate reductase alpha chain/ribonucleoside-triphosphate reductase
MQIKKRDGKLQEYDNSKIETAVKQASEDSILGVDINLVRVISHKVDEWIKQVKEIVSVEDIQDKVEEFLMDSERKDIAKSYIIYRQEREKERLTKKEEKNQLLTDEFISKYKHKPFPMGTLGEFIYYRTYSKYIHTGKNYGRREYWYETVRRTVEYICKLMPTTKKEAEEIYDDIYYGRMLPSMRSLWIGGSSVTDVSAMANLNCSFMVVDNIENLAEGLYILMVGSGLGFRILKSDVEKIPLIRTDISLIHEQYIKIPKDNRKEHTSLLFEDDKTVKIVIGDSRQGWTEAFKYYLNIISSKFYKDINRIIINYDNIRPAGEPLKSFGGRASGHFSMLKMFDKLNKLLKSDTGYLKLRPIHVLDMANIAAENIVVGGTRRVAEIALISPDDKECIEAKSNLYKQINGEWVIDKNIEHRQLSNNTIVYESKPSRDFWHWHLNKMRYSGEPGILNLEAAKKRNPNAHGVNPCGEIILDNKQNCNLSTVNMMAFVNDGNLDMNELERVVKLNSRIGYRMTNLDLELPEWDATLKRDRLMAVNPTGYADMVNGCNLTKDEEVTLLKKMKNWVIEAANEYADSLGLNRSLLKTALKPSGNSSTLLGVSPGIHYPHSEYYIRRVRISRHDPLAQVMIDLGFSIKPEVGQDWDNCNTIVVEFPVKAPKGKTKYDVSAIEQLEMYKMFMDNYTEHNNSITISVRDEEWDDVEEWVWNYWDEIVAVSFLPLTDSFYSLMPYESIDEETYNNMLEELPKFSPSLLSQYEKEEYNRDDDLSSDCDSGVCGVR